jgi:hypothetical protein
MKEDSAVPPFQAHESFIPYLRNINPVSTGMTIRSYTKKSCFISYQGNLYISQATHRLRNIYSVSSNDQEIPSILSCSILLDYPFLSGHFCPFLCDVNPTSL